MRFSFGTTIAALCLTAPTVSPVSCVLFVRSVRRKKKSSLPSSIETKAKRSVQDDDGLLLVAVLFQWTFLETFSVSQRICSGYITHPITAAMVTTVLATFDSFDCNTMALPFNIRVFMNMEESSHVSFVHLFHLAKPIHSPGGCFFL
jgi:hypothetical protein